jgi:hypothetical protein
VTAERRLWSETPSDSDRQADCQQDVRIHYLVQYHSNLMCRNIWSESLFSEARAEKGIQSFLSIRTFMILVKIWGFHSADYEDRRFGGTYCLHVQGRKIRNRGTRVSLPLTDIPLLPACWPSPRPYPSPLSSYPMWPKVPPSLFLYSWLFPTGCSVCSHLLTLVPGRWIFYPKDGGDTFSGTCVNLGCRYTAPYPRRRHSCILRFINYIKTVQNPRMS